MSAWTASKSLMELRVHMCQTSLASKGVRDFWAKNYSEVKLANASLPILLRESTGAPAKLTATFERGVEKSMAVEGLSESEFSAELKKLMQ